MPAISTEKFLNPYLDWHDSIKKITKTKKRIRKAVFNGVKLTLIDNVWYALVL